MNYHYRTLVILIAFVSCTTPEGHDRATSPLPTADLSEIGPGPSHMDPTGEGVHGRACAYTPQQWSSAASPLLEETWPAVGTLYVGIHEISSARSFREFMDGAARVDAHHAALALNVLLNDLELYGRYANLSEAQIVGGTYHGLSARAALAHANGLGQDALDVFSTFNQGFNGCPPEWYSEDCEYGLDDDGDGVPEDLDCDPDDPTIGQVLYQSDFDEDDGALSPTDALSDAPWDFDGNSVHATDGGQQAMLGDDETYSDIVVYATVSSEGTRPACGFECEDACGPYVPDDCYEPWEAVALGILTAASSPTGVLTVSNSGDHDVCLDGMWSMWDAPGTQALTIGSSRTDMESYRVPAGGSIEFFYGSWTTDNGVESRYLSENPWWCYQSGVYFTHGIDYTMLAAVLPDDFREFIEDDTDWDADGVEDHIDWATHYGVQTQINMWDYQATHAVLSLGKTAHATGDGTVATILTASNRGELDLVGGTLEDTIPANWSLVGCDTAPATETANPDDTTTLTWNVSLGGCTEGCTLIEALVITCEIQHTLPVDLDHLVLPAASGSYNDSEDDETSWSMPAVAFDYDHDGDGVVRCGHTDRWRVGLLARAERDGDQDEGFHGYRCALASNSVEDCYDPGTFLQIAAFIDAPEDDISSECTEDCTVNTTFEQLARVEHDAVDLTAGEEASLAFWAVGDALSCELTNADGDVVSASATDDSEATGGAGLSTLNSFGDYDDLKVCEAFEIPS